MKKKFYAKSQEDLTTLRSYAKYRILNDMIDNVRRYAVNKDYQILILDKSATKVFSSCCKYFDMFQVGLYHIERLEVKRKRYPKSDVIYFISPTPESVKKLVEDFEKSDKLQYGCVHLCFTSHLSDELLKLIATQKVLAPRIYSFNEINLDFYLFNDNVYHFAKRNLLPAFKIVDESVKGISTPAIQTMIEELAHRLFTVCTTFVEYPYVMYQGKSVICQAIAQKVNEILRKFYLEQQSSKKSGNPRFREPRATLLILDRGFDMVAPILHDYSYQTIVYDINHIGEEGEINLGDSGSRTAFLNDQDECWVRFRNKHIAEVHSKLNEEVSTVARESKKLVGKSTDEMSLQEMSDVIRSMPKYEEMMKKYQVHMELINRSITDFTKYNWRKLISLEQDIITGIDGKGGKINNTSVVKDISQISKNLRDVDYLRLLMIYFACFDLNKKDKDTMLKSISNETYRTILQNMEFLDQDLASENKKFGRRREEMSVDEFNEFQRRFSQSQYDILRSEPHICKLIRQIHNGTIDEKTYPYLEKPKQTKKAKEVKKKGAAALGTEFDHSDMLENPRIFVFVFGGLSHHEIVSIANMQSSINAQIIPGSNQILNSREYLHQMEKLHKKESEVDFIKNMARNNSDKDDDSHSLEDEDTQENTYAINF